MTQETNHFGAWQPWQPEDVARFFAPLTVPWWIAGGWAIDLFLGRQTREHEDLDVQVLRRDQRAVRALFGNWDLEAALPLPRDETWPFRPWHLDQALDPAIHDVWCRPAATQPWSMQLMIADTRDDWWLFRRAPTVGRALADLGGLTTEGIPYLAPEIQLLYKAKQPRPKDEADFAQVLPSLGQKRRQWLSHALGVVHPDHPWRDRLS